MVAVPIGPFSFVPSQQLSNNQSVSAVKRNTKKKKTNSSAVTVSLMAYSRVVTTISAKCSLFLLFFKFSIQINSQNDWRAQ
jgi:hypothetical protein